jgi:hypothetical protein
MILYPNDESKYFEFLEIASKDKVPNIRLILAKILKDIAIKV